MVLLPRLILLALVALAVGPPPWSSAFAQDTTFRGVRIGLTYSPGTKPGVLVLPVNGTSGDSVRAMIQRDFDFGDRIAVITAEGDGFPETPVPGRSGNYPIYGKLGAVAIVQATVTPSGVHVAVHDVAKQEVARVRDFPVAGAPLSPEWRLDIHAVSDELENWITGVRGVAATRIAYSSGDRVWIIDSDGANPTPVSDGGSRGLSPSWHPRGTHLTYMQLTNRGTGQIAVKELAGGVRVLNVPGGMNMTPAFSPDGSTIVYAHAGDDPGTDLFAAPAFEAGPARRVTVGRGRGENTNPTFSPDGRRIAFTSGRDGHPEVYISDADGTNPDLLTPFKFGDQLYRASPDWSPDGRLIAFMSQIAGRFQIMTISLRDRSIKQHTSDGENEAPAWAPDSRHLVFSSTRGGAKQLWILDIESGRARQLTTGTQTRLAAWSPSLRKP